MITLKYTLVCDDVRREDNGKLMVVGLYTPNITIPQLPFVLPTLTFLQCLESDRPGNWSVKMRLQHLETGRNVMEAHGMMPFPQPGIAMAPVKLGNIQIRDVGAYNFVVEIEGQPNPLITDFSVILNIPPQAGQPQQPMR